MWVIMNFFLSWIFQIKKKKKEKDNGKYQDKECKGLLWEIVREFKCLDSFTSELKFSIKVLTIENWFKDYILL